MEAPPDFLPYASYHLAMLIGRELRGEQSLALSEISHRNFAVMRDALDGDGDRYYMLSVESLGDALLAYYGGPRCPFSSSPEPSAAAASSKC